MDSGPPILVQAYLTERRFMQACHQLWSHQAIGRRGNIIIAGLVILLGAILIRLDVPGPFGWILLAFAGAMLALDFGRDRLWRRYYQESPLYRAGLPITFTDSGIYLDLLEGAHGFGWADMRNYVYTRDFCILIIDRRRFIPIPRDAFDSPADHAAVEDLLRRHLKPLSSRLL